MTKYHINQHTGDYGECRAEIKCPLGDSVIHMENLSSVTEYSELIMEEKYGALSPMRKKQKDRKIPKAEDIELTVNSKYPYPEANRLEKVDQVVFGLKEGQVSSDVVSSVIGTADRVSHYYAEAACYLGLAETVVDDNGNKAFSLTQDGSDYVKQDKAGRENIMKRSINNIDLVQKLQNENDNDNDKVLNHISSTHNENSQTAGRKLSSMRSWSRQINEDSFLNDIDSEEVDEKIAEGWELYERKRNDSPTVPKEKFGEVCQTCFMTKSLTGVCDNCDD